MGNPVVHFEIMGGPDPQPLWDYYSQLFGWEVNADNPMNYGIVDRENNQDPDGIGVGGGICGAPEGATAYATFYVGVDDVEAALAKAESLGGTRVVGPMQVPDGPTIGQFTDPAGNLIGVVKA